MSVNWDDDASVGEHLDDRELFEFRIERNVREHVDQYVQSRIALDRDFLAHELVDDDLADEILRRIAWLSELGETPRRTITTEGGE